jgi:hypothetical protein
MPVNYADFERRLQRYGLALADIKGKHLVFGGGVQARLTLSGAGGIAPTQVLRTNSLDQLKTWIGFSDDDVASGRITLAQASLDLLQVNYTTAVRNAQRRAATPQDEQTLAGAARAYVFGDSRKVSQYKQAIESTLGPFLVAVQAAETITIQPGTPYIVQGPAPVVITTGEMIFEGPTAQFISYAPLKVDAANLVMQS